MGRKFLSVSKKLRIVFAAELIGNVLGTARVNNVQPNQICQWRRDKEKLIEKTVRHSQCLMAKLHTIMHKKTSSTAG